MQTGNQEIDKMSHIKGNEYKTNCGMAQSKTPRQHEKDPWSRICHFVFGSYAHWN